MDRRRRIRRDLDGFLQRAQVERDLGVPHLARLQRETVSSLPERGMPDREYVVSGHEARKREPAVARRGGLQRCGQRRTFQFNDGVRESGTVSLRRDGAVNGAFSLGEPGGGSAEHDGERDKRVCTKSHVTLSPENTSPYRPHVAVQRQQRRAHPDGLPPGAGQDLRTTTVRVNVRKGTSGVGATEGEYDDRLSWAGSPTPATRPTPEPGQKRRLEGRRCR
jgi:hypothetical protein